MGQILALIEVDVKDPAKLKEYIKGHLPTIAMYGGRVVLRSEGLESVEGGWSPKLFVIHEWPSTEAFKKWYSSPEYQPWKTVRKEACELKISLARKL